MRRYIILASALLACAAASAQNLNPTVQVTNDYQGKLMEVEKQNVQMAVPDSLLKFDWNFNYSVFDNPYRGAYEFSPYRIDMKPDATKRDERRFYLRAGAGYSLHPEAQLVVSPATKGKFGLSFYDDFKGYIGKYHDFNPETNLIQLYDVIPVGDYTGHDLSNRLGTAIRYDAVNSIVTFDGGFDFLKTDGGFVGANKALGGSAALRLRSIGDSDFVYDASLGWAGLGNRLIPNDLASSLDESYKENDFGFDASLGFRLAESHTIGLDPSWHHTVFTETFAGGTSMRKAFADRVDLAPYYRFSEDGFTVRVGIRFSDVWRDFDVSESPVTLAVADYNGRKIYPDFRLSYEAIPDKLVLSAKVTGGQAFNTYRSYLMSNHHFSFINSRNYYLRAGDASVNTFDAGIGASGRVRSIFQYSAEAGFARYFNSPMDGIEATYYYRADEGSYYPYSGNVKTVLVPVVSMVNYDLLYARFGGELTTDRLDASARLKFQSDRTNEHETGYFAMSLPVFTGSAEVVYNWNRRLFAGLTGEWATSRHGEGAYSSYGQTFDCQVPGWFDLGVTAEFKANNRFSVWAVGRNLLNKTVMRDFMIAEKGPYFTAGICLNF